MTQKITTERPQLKTAHLATLLDAETRHILQILNAAKGMETHKAMIVGGAVRDALMGRSVHDIDIATILTPKDVMGVLNAAGIKTYETGIEHGTITAILNAHSYEITTLRRDVSTDGRRATVAFTKDWAEDAQRRDFTINALYLDIDGHIHDPTEQGLNDIQAQHVRFVGHAEQRIEEDALRILRFIRFWARFERQSFSPAGQPWQIIANMKPALKRLSKERITQELLMICSGPKVTEVAELMHSLGIIEALGLMHDKASPFTELSQSLEQWKKLFTFEFEDDSKALFQCHAMVMFLGGDSLKLSLSNKQKKQIESCNEVVKKLHEAVDDKKLRQYAYDYGKTPTMVALCLYQSGMEWAEKSIEVLGNWDVPEFPLRGQDLIDAGAFEQNDPSIGRWLKHAKQEWLDSDFSLSKNSLFDSILKEIQSKDQP